MHLTEENPHLSISVVPGRLGRGLHQRKKSWEIGGRDIKWLINWLVDWFIYWLIDRLFVILINKQIWYFKTKVRRQKNVPLLWFILSDAYCKLIPNSAVVWKVFNLAAEKNGGWMCQFLKLNLKGKGAQLKKGVTKRMRSKVELCRRNGYI